jgi:hypothetical protein
MIDRTHDLPIDRLHLEFPAAWHSYVEGGTAAGVD